MKRFCGTGFLFIGTHAIQAAHKYISQYGGIGGFGKEAYTDMKPRIAFNAGQIHGDNRNLLHTRLFQSPPDETDIVGGTAAAAGLAHHDCDLIQIVSAGMQRLHNLSHDNEGRITGVIVYIFQSHVHGMFVVVRQYLQPIAA